MDIYIFDRTHKHLKIFICILIILFIFMNLAKLYNDLGGKKIFSGISDFMEKSLYFKKYSPH